MPQRDHNDSDPFYASAMANFARLAATHWTGGFQVVTDPGLDTRVVELARSDREIRVRPGLDLCRYRDVVNAATYYLLGGPEWAPEFQTGPVASPGRRRLWAVP